MALHQGRPKGSGVVWPSAKTVYALQACILLAAAYPDTWVKADEIAHAADMPHRFVQQILGELRMAGLVASRRGYQGGFRLARDPHRISVGDAARAVDTYELFVMVPRRAATPRVDFIDALRDRLRNIAHDAFETTSIAAIMGTG